MIYFGSKGDYNLN